MALRLASFIAALGLAAVLSTAGALAATAAGEPSRQAANSPSLPSPPAPRPASRPKAAGAPASVSRAERLAGVKTWGIQLQELEPSTAQRAPFDLFVVDATSGVKGGTAFSKEQISALKTKPDGSQRLLISYLSIGEAEDYRADYFTADYMTEDAPDWLLSENERWKGNRRIRFCEEGWQRTILGDDDGRNVYNSVEPSPLYKLIEAGFDGVYLDRVDVYPEVEAQCPDAARKMVAFVERLAAHARKKNPNFIVILQNAEELLRQPAMVAAIDAVAKEDLFYGADHSERANPPAMVKDTVNNLAIARAAGKPVFILDYLSDGRKRADDRAKIEAQGFIAYFGPRKLDTLWLQENFK